MSLRLIKDPQPERDEAEQKQHERVHRQERERLRVEPCHVVDACREDRPVARGALGFLECLVVRLVLPACSLEGCLGPVLSLRRNQVGRFRDHVHVPRHRAGNSRDHELPHRPAADEEQRQSPRRVRQQDIEPETRLGDEAEHGERADSPQIIRDEPTSTRVRSPKLNGEPDAEEDREHRPEALLEEQLDGALIELVRRSAARGERAEVHEEHADQRDAAEHVEDVEAVAVGGDAIGRHGTRGRGCRRSSATTLPRARHPPLTASIACRATP